MTDALTISGLKKSYPDFVLDGVSFSVPRGSIVGLIGENGAGKAPPSAPRWVSSKKRPAASLFWARRSLITRPASRSVWYLTAIISRKIFLLARSVM